MKQIEPAGLAFVDHDGEGVIGALKVGLQYELEDLVNLELTAEQMLQEEMFLVRSTLTEDAKHIWSDLVDGLTPIEMLAGKWLLIAADPTSLEWQRHHWWGGEMDTGGKGVDA